MNLTTTVMSMIVCFWNVVGNDNDDSCDNDYDMIVIMMMTILLIIWWHDEVMRDTLGHTTHKLYLR